MRSKTLLLCAGLIAATLNTAHAQEAAPAADTKLSLEAAIRQTLTYSPKLKAGLEGIGVSRGERQQSGLIPNPEFSAEAENFAGTKSAKGFDAAEVTLGVAQPIEMGGKRSARIKAADMQMSIADLELRATALDLVRDTTVAWAEAVAAHEEVEVAQNQQELAEDVLQSVARRVAAAAEPAIQQSKSEVALASSKIALQKAERNLEAAMKNLARMWGQDAVDYQIDEDSFFTTQDVQGKPSLENNPDVKLLQAGIGLAGANLDVEKANAVPDVTVGAGIRDSRGDDSQAFVASLSIPFPVFNRNQGNIMKAGHEVAKAEHQKTAAVQEIELELVRVQNALQTSRLEIESLEKSIVPAAEKSFALAKKGYTAGKFPYLEVLDAQRTLADVHMQHVSALKDYHIAQAQFDRLTGKNVDLLNAYGDKNAQ
ncbi:MAG: TolC family protein [Alphaproteobacteria bacterium]|nr:MAG: TolC family protein [Alphaproteobacteria bacterium]